MTASVQEDHPFFLSLDEAIAILSVLGASIQRRKLDLNPLDAEAVLLLKFSLSAYDKIHEELGISPEQRYPEHIQ